MEHASLQWTPVLLQHNYKHSGQVMYITEGEGYYFINKLCQR